MRACVFGDGGCHGTRPGADARTHSARPAVWIRCAFRDPSVKVAATGTWLAGTWLGLRLYGHLDEAGFRRLVLILLLVSGVTLTL